jgi:hypothetical protein
MVTSSDAMDFALASALLVAASPVVYFGYRGKLDGLVIPAFDINPFYWLFRRRHRDKPLPEVNKAFAHAFWLVNVVFLVVCAIGMVDWGISLFISRH